VSALKGRPERGQNAGKAVLSDDATVKITTRVSLAQHRDMKIVAARNSISIEDAYREAIDEYLKTR
jgi:hypothetical protein